MRQDGRSAIVGVQPGLGRGSGRLVMTVDGRSDIAAPAPCGKADRQQAGSYESGAVIVRTCLRTLSRTHESPIPRSTIMADPVGASLLAITDPRHPAKAPEKTLKTVNPAAADSQTAAVHRRGGGSPASWLLRKRCGERAPLLTRLRAESKRSPFHARRSWSSL